MAFSATAFRILIASASDVTDERGAAERAIRRWNSLHAREEKKVLYSARWELDVTSEQGMPAQDVVNRLVDDCDMLVGIFWHRLGTRTNVAPSGTIEEVERFLNKSLPVSLFCSTRPVPQNVLQSEPSQFTGLNEVLDKYKPKGFVTGYTSVEDFENRLFDTLVERVRRMQVPVVEGLEVPAPVASMPNPDPLKISFVMALTPTPDTGQSEKALAVQLTNGGQRPLTVTSCVMMFTQGEDAFPYYQLRTNVFPNWDLPKKLADSDTLTLYYEVDQIQRAVRDVADERPGSVPWAVIVKDSMGKAQFAKIPDNFVIEMEAGNPKKGHH